MRELGGNTAIAGCRWTARKAEQVPASVDKDIADTSSSSRFGKPTHFKHIVSGAEQSRELEILPTELACDHAECLAVVEPAAHVRREVNGLMQGHVPQPSWYSLNNVTSSPASSSTSSF